MERLKKLMSKKDDITKRMRTILDSCDKEDRSFSADEEKDYTQLDKDLDAINVEIKREERLYNAEVQLEQPLRKINLADTEARDNSNSEWENFGEFLYSVAFNRNDSRIKTVEFRTQSVKEGTSGGIMVPNQFSPTLLSVTPQTAIVRPRATVLDAGTPPDSSITMPVLDQTSAQNMYGGVSVSWIAEGGTKPETGMKLREITLTPQEVAAYIIVTDKLLRNWGAASTTLMNQLRAAIIAAEDNAFLTGNGVGKPKGVINSPAALTVNRTTAGQIVRADIDTMYSKIWEEGSEYVWIASPTCKPYLMSIADGGSNNLWMGNYTAATPPSLLGAPIIWSQRNVALGTKGDLMLVNLKYYLVKNGSGPFVEASPHVYFTSNKTVIKAFWNVDGRAWLEEPIPLEGDATKTLSPFVILN